MLKFEIKKVLSSLKANIKMIGNMIWIALAITYINYYLQSREFYSKKISLLQSLLNFKFFFFFLRGLLNFNYSKLNYYI